MSYFDDDYNTNKDKILKLINKYRQNPKKLLFGNIINYFPSNSDMNDGTTDDDGLTVIEYLRTLKKQKLVSWSKAINIVNAKIKKNNQRAKVMDDKIIRDETVKNNKARAKGRKIVDLYKNDKATQKVLGKFNINLLNR